MEKERREKVALFMGSFNPIHIGHMALANYIAEYCGMDKVVFVVSPQNPLKEAGSLIGDEARLEMARLATEGYPRFEVSDIERTLPRPNYTATTLRKLTETHPGTDYSLVIGADNLEIFDKWKDYEWILQNYDLLVYPRRGYRCEKPSGADYSRVKIIDRAPVIEVSSTAIRQSMAQGRDLRYYMPEKVAEYVREKRLYM